jgi:hypothetical protein
VSFYSEKTVKARNAYRCQFCGQQIARGVVHVHVSMEAAGDYHSHRAHCECHEAATGYRAELPATAAACAR